MEVLVLSVIIGTQFSLSALAKISDLSAFVTILGNYPLIRYLNYKTLAVIIIVFEIWLGFSLLSLQGEIIRFALIGAIIFIFLASLLSFIRLIKGEKKFRCGCGGSLDEEQSGVWLLIRNFFWLVVLLFCLKQNIPSVFLISKEALNLFLNGFGLLAIIKLFFIILRATLYIKQWKAVG
jgi:hypothetical protein